ncbi:MAG: serine hydrolase [Gemmatimonadota bacterium]|nr:MAG: serine hydrolase [Gemmatimonadota bacterium]
MRTVRSIARLRGSAVISLLYVTVLAGTTGCAADPLADLESRLQARIAESGAEVVGIYFRNLTSGDSVLLDVDSRVHAASMMKVPVMIQLFRDADAGRLSLDDSLVITKTFASIVDGTPYELGAPDDSDSTLYARIGEKESIRQLTELMITISSNLATNMLIEFVGAERVQETMWQLGADSIAVLRGVEDIKAYRAGLNNTTTARDLGVISSAIAEHRAASFESCREMIAILSRQQFNEGIPAGLPAGTLVAHKTGSITEIRHDGGVVYLEDDAAYVLVVLTKGIADSAVADQLIADISRTVYETVTRPSA